MTFEKFKCDPIKDIAVYNTKMTSAVLFVGLLYI